MKMTDKAYIVANEQQEREVLEKLEREDITWRYSLNKTTQFIPSRYHNIVTFPYSLKVIGATVSMGRLDGLDNYEIVFDGRNEEHMSEKYVVSQEFMNELKEWKDNLVKYNEPGGFIDIDDLEGLPVVVNAWWGDEVPDDENNNRLIAIIRWVNGEDVFEVEKPKKWVVRSKEVNDDGDKHYWKLLNLRGVLEVTSTFELRLATKFDTKEEAESWANSHQEVVEVVDV